MPKFLFFVIFLVLIFILHNSICYFIQVISSHYLEEYIYTYVCTYSTHSKYFRCIELKICLFIYNSVLYCSIYYDESYELWTYSQPLTSIILSLFCFSPNSSTFLPNFLSLSLFPSLFIIYFCLCI